MKFTSRACFAPNCKTGYRTNKSGEKLSMFCAPKNPLDFELWKKSIPRKDKLLTTKDVLCERHFKPGDIIREWKSGDVCILIG